jgi:uroporphyrinogen-III synthase
MAEGRQKIWITRAQPGADSTAERVRALGHEPVVVPLLAVKVLEGVEIDLSGIGALAFTSANGVRAFADSCRERSLRVFAVGQATAQTARAAGFHSVLSTDGDVDVLAAGIAARKNEIRGAILHPGAAEPAGDLAGALEAHGIETRRLVLYETADVELRQAEAEALTQSHVALVHSPRAAQVLAKLLKAHPAPNLRVIGLSKAVVRPLQRTKLAAKAYPSVPLESALINLIDDRP